MPVGFAAMLKKILVRTARFFQGVCQDRQAVERLFIVNALCYLRNCAVIPSQAIGTDGHLTKGIPKEFTEENRLPFLLMIVGDRPSRIKVFPDHTVGGYNSSILGGISHISIQENLVGNPP